MLADNLGADFRVPFHLLPFGCGEATGFMQHLCRNAEFADVVQGRSLHHQVAQFGLAARRLGDQTRVVAQPDHAITDGGALVIFHGAREAAHQLHARGFEFRGAFTHQRFLFLALAR